MMHSGTATTSNSSGGGTSARAAFFGLAGTARFGAGGRRAAAAVLVAVVLVRRTSDEDAAETSCLLVPDVRPRRVGGDGDGGGGSARTVVRVEASVRRSGFAADGVVSVVGADKLSRRMRARTRSMMPSSCAAGAAMVVRPLPVVDLSFDDFGGITNLHRQHGTVNGGLRKTRTV